MPKPGVEVAVSPDSLPVSHKAMYSPIRAGVNGQPSDDPDLGISQQAMEGWGRSPLDCWGRLYHFRKLLFRLSGRIDEYPLERRCVIATLNRAHVVSRSRSPISCCVAHRADT
jgi:hypothetical protein